MQDKRLLAIISNETKQEVCNLDIITPEIFTKIFIEKAKSHGIEEIEGFVSNYIQQQIQNYLDIQSETSKHADKLSKTTSRAIEAMKEQDEGVLESVISETQKLREEINALKESLYKDELTGAYNRKWLFDHIVEENNEECIKGGVIVFVDLNYFKIINDTYGHIIGDKVLLFITKQLKSTKGKVVRYGGDEFLVFFEGRISPQEVRKRIESLREDLLKKHIKAKDAEFRVSFSYGLSSCVKGDALDEVIERVDSDMYRDKKEIKKRIPGIEVG